MPDALPVQVIYGDDGKPAAQLWRDEEGKVIAIAHYDEAGEEIKSYSLIEYNDDGSRIQNTYNMEGVLISRAVDS